MSIFDHIVECGITLNEIKILKHSSFSDHRGKIWTSFDKSIELNLGLPIEFVHDKFAQSHRGVLRGIHYDDKSYKLVTCITGNIQQVIVDLRPDSANYLKWESFDLSGESPTSILVPPMFGNAFLVKSYVATYHYKLAYIGEYNDADKQYTVKWDDPRINIKWEHIPSNLSERDK